MQISVDMIKALRQRTSAGVMDSKHALEEAGGDLDRAEEILREQGVASAAKKADRETSEGLVETYVHSGGRIGAMVEMNCETDFVARTPEFRELAHDVALQVAAMSPLFVDAEDIPEGEPVEPEQSCLLRQPFIKDTTRTVGDLVTETVGKLGENIRIRRFSRYSLGE